jgi:hypothetical protein
MDKRELIECVLQELRVAQHKQWLPPRVGPVKRIPFPPVLPTQGHGNLFVTERLLECVTEYARTIANGHPNLKVRFKAAELKDLAARAFGDALYEVDLSRSQSELVEDNKDLGRRSNRSGSKFI